MSQTEPSLPAVFFNHLYVVLDDKTYRAIQASDFLRSAFSGMERRTTRTAAGEGWSGTYYYGVDSYLEFFGESTGAHWKPAARAGWGGIAFSSDTPGGAEAVRRKIEAEFGYAPHFELRKLQTPDQPVNWFYNTRLAETLDLDSFDSWLMEFHPDIYRFKGIPYNPETGPTRQSYLAPWNRADGLDRDGKPRKSAPVFTRITGATVQMDHANARRYTQILRMLGYAEHEETGQITLSAHGFALTIRLHSEDAAPPGYRLSSFRLAMARPSVAPMTFVFAPGSRLVLYDNLTAEWSFEG